MLRPVSLMKTSRALPQSGWALRQRLRAALTSGRACAATCVVFFIAQAESIKLMPERGETDLDLELFLAAQLKFHQS